MSALSVSNEAKALFSRGSKLCVRDQRDLANLEMKSSNPLCTIVL